MSQEAHQGNRVERVSLSAFLDPRTHDQLVAIARREDRSVSSIVRAALAVRLQGESKPG